MDTVAACKHFGITVWTIAFMVMILVKESCAQSCGPRVSARLLAEIPCDMSQSSYCSAPGSAYPWSSVKRYIHDNQGLVRRMYGDEKHSAVLLNEIDFDRDPLTPFDRRDPPTRFRTVYGRSLRPSSAGRRRQPRPQLFRDDPTPLHYTASRASSAESTTQHNSKGEEVTTSPRGTSSTTPVTTTQHDSEKNNMVTTTRPNSEKSDVVPTTQKGSSTPDRGEPTAGQHGSTTTGHYTSGDVTTPEDEPPVTIFRVVTETSIKVGDPVTRAIPTTTVSYEPASEMESHPTTTTTAMHRHQSTTTHPTTVSETTESSSTVAMTTTVVEELPVAMERVGYEEELDDYEDDEELEGRRRVDPSVMENSVEEKGDMRRREEEEEEEEKEEVKEEEKKESTEEEEELPKRAIKACPVKNEVIAPYWANNTRGETLALLNVHPFEQYVHFEKCAFEHHQMLCRDGCRCEQQYRLHRLLAFDPKNECRGIFSDWFKFPSCCVCMCYDLTPDMPFLRRRGRI